MAQAQSKTGNGVELERTKLSSLVQDVGITGPGLCEFFEKHFVIEHGATPTLTGREHFPCCVGQIKVEGRGVQLLGRRVYSPVKTLRATTGRNKMRVIARVR